MDTFKKILAGVYLQYEIIFCMGYLEPWERRLINTIVFCSIFLMIFSAYVFLPDYLSNLMELFKSHDSNSGFQPMS
ncbi:unnamed protein product [Chironomus riparius]|uniref:Serine palmitoyltransferase small subunit B n=1 Tax=Chironomus riparius TaxID=315576 RepID=A0A9N9S3V2_9DIPT|nr:unnamed protein product [Chironomus riparius]